MYASLPTSWSVRWDEPIVEQCRLNTVPQISDEFKVIKQRAPATDVKKVWFILKAINTTSTTRQGAIVTFWISRHINWLHTNLTFVAASKIVNSDKCHERSTAVEMVKSKTAHDQFVQLHSVKGNGNAASITSIRKDAWQLSISYLARVSDSRSQLSGVVHRAINVQPHGVNRRVHAGPKPNPLTHSRSRHGFYPGHLPGQQPS